MKSVINQSSNFLSDQYRQLHWSDLITKCYQPNVNGYPVVLGNQGWICLPTHFATLNKLNLQTLHGMMLIDRKALQFIDYDFLNDCGMSLAKFNLAEYEFDHQEQRYYVICEHILKEFLAFIKIIFSYTYDHLSNRASNNQRLTQLTPIQLSLANIVCLLDSAEKSLTLSNNINVLKTTISHLLSALNELAKLGGGRAILRGNAVELIFHGKFFQSIYLHGGKI